jgi:hypothetical protein
VGGIANRQQAFFKASTYLDVDMARELQDRHTPVLKTQNQRLNIHA